MGLLLIFLKLLECQVRYIPVYVYLVQYHHQEYRHRRSWYTMNSGVNDYNLAKASQLYIVSCVTRGTLRTSNRQEDEIIEIQVHQCMY